MARSLIAAIRILLSRTKAGSRLWLFVKRIKQILINDKSKRRIPNNISVAEFISILNQNNCRYAILRWFDNLPYIPYGEDLDILVADKDVYILDQVLTRSPRKGRIPCDVYSVSGMAGSSYNGVPYYPPPAADRLLNRTAEHVSGSRIPSMEDYFYSFVYHIIYHKGLQLELLDHVQYIRSTNAKNEYKEILHMLVKELGISIEMSTNSLKTVLDEEGWHPSREMLDAYNQRA